MKFKLVHSINWIQLWAVHIDQVLAQCQATRPRQRHWNNKGTQDTSHGYTNANTLLYCAYTACTSLHTKQLLPSLTRKLVSLATRSTSLRSASPPLLWQSTAQAISHYTMTPTTNYHLQSSPPTSHTHPAGLTHLTSQVEACIC